MRIALLFFITIASISNSEAQILSTNRVEVPVERRAEAIYFYQNNWKAYREMALQSGLISSYRILEFEQTDPESLELLLVTEFADSLQFTQVEANFEPIIKTLRPNGPVLLNDIPPAEFRTVISSENLNVISDPQD